MSVSVGQICIDYALGDDKKIKLKIITQGSLPLVTQVDILELVKASMLEPPSEDLTEYEEYDGL